MTSTDQMYVVLAMVAAIWSAAWFVSEDEAILIEINKVQAERILRQEVYVDTLINWVEECWEIRQLNNDSISLKQTLIKIDSNTSLQYKNYHLYLTKYPPGFESYQSMLSRKFLKR